MKSELHKNLQTENDQESRSAIVSYLLEQLQEKLSEELDRVEASIKLLPLGKKTKLVEDLEGKLNDPLSSIIETSMKLNHRVIEILAMLCSNFFAANRDHIEGIYLLPSNRLLLDYYIVLKLDNDEIRDGFYEFVNDVNDSLLSEIYEVHFNFLTSNEVALIPESRTEISLEHE